MGRAGGCLGGGAASRRQSASRIGRLKGLEADGGFRVYLVVGPPASTGMQPGYLFVYGTLLPGLAPPAVAEVVNRLRLVGPGIARGRLFHLGAYPGCVVDGRCDDEIHGQVLEIPPPIEPVLAKLDWYEGYVAGDADRSLFVRTVCPVTLADGRQVEAWVYVYNRDVSTARRIESGRYDPRWAG